MRVAAAQGGDRPRPRPGVARPRPARRVRRGPDPAFFSNDRFDGWERDTGPVPLAGAGSYSDFGWYPLTDLPANMLDRARVAVRNYAACPPE